MGIMLDHQLDNVHFAILLVLEQKNVKQVIHLLLLNVKMDILDKLLIKKLYVLNVKELQTH
jgi:hypothetical protein